MSLSMSNVAWLRSWRGLVGGKVIYAASLSVSFPHSSTYGGWLRETALLWPLLSKQGEYSIKKQNKLGNFFKRICRPQHIHTAHYRQKAFVVFSAHVNN